MLGRFRDPWPEITYNGFSSAARGAPRSRPPWRSLILAGAAAILLAAGLGFAAGPAITRLWAQRSPAPAAPVLPPPPHGPALEAPNAAAVAAVSPAAEAAPPAAPPVRLRIKASRRRDEAQERRAEARLRASAATAVANRQAVEAPDSTLAAQAAAAPPPD